LWGLNKVGPLRSDVSSGGVTVFVDQSTEDLGPLDSSVAVGTDVDVRDGRQLFQRSMGPMSVVLELVQDVDECRSLKISIRSRHSRRIVLTHRSA
jgi:hypothetical protein